MEFNVETCYFVVSFGIINYYYNNTCPDIHPNLILIKQKACQIANCQDWYSHII